MRGRMGEEREGEREDGRKGELENKMEKKYRPLYERRDEVRE